MKTTSSETTKRQRMTADESHRLKILAREIRQLHANTEALIRSAKDKHRAALAEAILCGQKLNAAKQIVGHGGWLLWLKKNVKEICEKTAQNYMRVAKAQHVADLKDSNSLRQAYIALGIIDDIDPETVVSKPLLEVKPDTNQSSVNQSTDEVPAIKHTAPKPGYVAPVVIGSVTKDTGEERVRRVRSLVVSLATELKAVPKEHMDECRRILAPLVAFTSEAQ